MNVEKVKKDFLEQLEDGFHPRKFETYVMKYLKNLSNNDEDVTKTLNYYDTTNDTVRIYIRTKTETHNISFPMKAPMEMRSSTFELT